VAGESGSRVAGRSLLAPAETQVIRAKRDLRWLRRAGSLLVVLWPLTSGTSVGADRAQPSTTYSPIERMETRRLKATHDDAKRIQESRRALPARPGLNDYRAILHAHAEDSAHTGGTRAEMLAEAKRAGIHAVLLSDHYRPPKDFVNDSWRGLRDGVLFLPGSEERGFLLYPTRSIMDRMKDPTPTLIEAVRTDGGLIFLSHIEERPDHSTAGLDGMEIYNRHADAKKDVAGLAALVLKLTDLASLQELETNLRLYPDELFAAQVQYPADYLAKWDAETKTRRLTGVAANDCHHNHILILKMVDEQTVKVGTNVDSDDQMRSVSASARPGIRALTKGHRAGDVLARLDLDPYHRSFQNVSTHVLAPALNEEAIRAALRQGHVYVGHDWMCDPSGFRFELISASTVSGGQDSDTARRVLMGDEATLSPGRTLVVQFPVSCHIRLLSQGKVVAERSGERLEHGVDAPGVYRAEGWLTLGGEERGWVYSNPIYVR
jgi:hypothetical protein